MKRGRKTLLTTALRKRVFEMLRRGHTIKTTCGTLGFSERSFHDYCAKDPAFLAATQRARAIGRMRIVDSILADRDWRSKAWYLERTASDGHFARKVALAKTAPPAQPFQRIDGCV
jgi:hypothetical protein